MKKVELTDFDDSFVKRLSKNSKELAEYKKFVIEEFEKDQNKNLLLEGLTTVAMALSLRNSKTASLAKYLNTSAKIESFRKAVVKEFNETKGMNAFLESLRIIAMAENKIKSSSAKKTKKSAQKENVYKMISKEQGSCLSGLMTITRKAGIDLKAVNANRAALR